jgi:thiamine biosynthesis protein ThiS
MMIRVRGKERPWREGMTVADLLKELNDPYPYAVVRIDGRVISMPHFEKTVIPDGAEIFLIPMIAGG